MSKSQKLTLQEILKKIDEQITLQEKRYEKHPDSVFLQASGRDSSFNKLKALRGEADTLINSEKQETEKWQALGALLNHYKDKTNGSFLKNLIVICKENKYKADSPKSKTNDPEQQRTEIESTQAQKDYVTSTIDNILGLIKKQKQELLTIKQSYEKKLGELPKRASQNTKTTPFLTREITQSDAAIEVLNSFEKAIKEIGAEVINCETGDDIINKCQELANITAACSASPTLNEARFKERNLLQRLFRWVFVDVHTTIQRLSIINELKNQAKELSIAGGEGNMYKFVPMSELQNKEPEKGKIYVSGSINRSIYDTYMPEEFQYHTLQYVLLDQKGNKQEHSSKISPPTGQNLDYPKIDASKSLLQNNSSLQNMMFSELSNANLVNINSQVINHASDKAINLMTLEKNKDTLTTTLEDKKAKLQTEEAKSKSNPANIMQRFKNFSLNINIGGLKADIEDIEKQIEKIETAIKNIHTVYPRAKVIYDKTIEYDPNHKDAKDTPFEMSASGITVRAAPAAAAVVLAVAIDPISPNILSRYDFKKMNFDI
jgi:hypothetical protein